ncbi:hypothetical protein Q9966_016529 [Columba livia]|nr:hypothetical protein Q9966_016529 [Columba livia]
MGTAAPPSGRVRGGGCASWPPGGVVIVSTARHRNAPGVVLQVSPGPPGPTFTVLVLSERRPEGGGQAAPPVSPMVSPTSPGVPDVPYPRGPAAHPPLPA